jgi:hypothetical protein
MINRTQHFISCSKKKKNMKPIVTQSKSRIANETFSNKWFHELAVKAVQM